MKEQKVFYSDSGELFYDMDEACINDKITELKRKSAEIYQEISKIQDNCSHNHMTVSAHADTGNYCRSDDSYWFEGQCRACGLSFNHEQSENSILRKKWQQRDSDPRVVYKK